MTTLVSSSSRRESQHPNLVPVLPANAAVPVFALTEATSPGRGQHAVTSSRAAKDRQALEQMKRQLETYLGAPVETAGDAMRVFHEHQKRRKVAERNRFLESKASNRELARKRIPPPSRGSGAKTSPASGPSTSSSFITLPSIAQSPRGLMTSSSSSPRGIHTARTTSSRQQPIVLPTPPNTARVPQPPSSPKPATIKTVDRVDELPALVPGYRAKAYVSERLTLLHRSEALKTQFMEGIQAKLRQESAVNRLETDARTDMLRTFLAERQDAAAFYEQVAQARDIHTREVRHRRIDTARSELRTREAAQQAADERAALAVKCRLEAEANAERAEQWSRLIALIVASRVMRRMGDSALRRMRAGWKVLRVVVVAAWWRGRVRARLRKRAELRSNVHLGKSLPDALVRVRRRMYQRPTDVVLKFLTDVRKAKHFAMTVTHYLRSLRRSQAILRRHLAARALWHKAMLLSWERTVQERILRQFNTTYPRDAIGLPPGKGAIDVLGPGMPRPQLFADTCITAFVRQEHEQRAAVTAFGLNNLTDSVVAPPVKKPKGGPGGPREDVLVAYVPASLRLRIVKEITSALCYQRCRRLAAAEDRRLNGGPALEVPRLRRFVDRRSMGKLVSLVETKIAQSRAAVVLEAQLAVRAAEIAAGSAASAKGFADLSRTGAKGELSRSDGGEDDPELLLSATAAFEAEQLQQALAEAALYAPECADTPNKSDARIATDILLTVVTGHAMGIPLTSSQSSGHSPLSPHAGLESATSRSVSPTQAARRKRILDAEPSSSDRAALHVAMAMRDAADELVHIAQATVVPTSVLFAIRFAEDY